MTTSSQPPLTWDIFCHVIDNWGDLGVGWRLCRQLAARQQVVRLWVDEAQPLQWMAPGALEGQCPGLQVLHWPRSDPGAPAPTLPPSDVLIEAFGCDIQPHWVQALQPPDDHVPFKRVWINLEYLSAEPYVERCHRLASPVLHGPLSGRVKWFYYPGFTPQTGGLLRESDLFAQQSAFDPHNWLSAHLPSLHPDAPRKPLVSLFCYEPDALPDLLRQTQAQSAHWLIAPGRAHNAFHTALPAKALPPHTELPHLPQTEFDRLLWSCDLNFVRGEDSLVRALWAGRPFVWHIYPQHDNAHHDKLLAFLDWLQAPASLRDFHLVWNGVSPGPLPAWNLPEWQACVRLARDQLLSQTDLVTQLLAFVTEKR